MTIPPGAMPIEHFDTRMRPLPPLTAKRKREIKHNHVLFLRKLRVDRDMWKADCRKARARSRQLQKFVSEYATKCGYLRGELLQLEKNIGRAVELLMKHKIDLHMK